MVVCVASTCGEAFIDGTNIVDNVTVSYRDIRIAVEADEKGASREWVLGVEGVADKTRGVDCSATLERGAGLDVGGQGKLVFVRVGVGGGVVRPGGPWLGFRFRAMWLIVSPLEDLPLSYGSGVQMKWAMSPVMRSCIEWGNRRRSRIEMNRANKRKSRVEMNRAMPPLRRSLSNCGCRRRTCQAGCGKGVFV